MIALRNKLSVRSSIGRVFYLPVVIILLLIPCVGKAQLPPVFGKTAIKNSRSEPITRVFLPPVRVVWQSDTTSSRISNVNVLLKKGHGQADLAGSNLCILKGDSVNKPGIVLDFGRELQGGLQLITDQSRGGKPVRVRLRFGESVAEAMSDVADTTRNATNDHAMRDLIVPLPWLGKLEIGNTGYRFVRIDLVDSNSELKLKEVSAIFNYRDIPYLGSFHSSDTLLNKIWMTGAYTVHLNMQDYLWDGVKRDRLVWVGDMHPETSTIAAVFGSNDVVEKSLDQARDITPYPQYMAGMVSYSMWWVIIQHDWYMNTGNLAYLRQQKTYLQKLLNQLCQKIDTNNSEILDGGNRFLDWPSSGNDKAIHAGLQGLLMITLRDGAALSRQLGDKPTADACDAVVARLKTNVPDAAGSKQAAALMGMAGLISPAKADSIISANGVHNYSTYFGYYMLQAKAKAGNYSGALNDIKQYWGAMLSLGATTFWEDFDINWAQNAGRIDELVPPGKVDIHGTYGGYCYKGFRHSLAHGWASGPTPWLTEHVLGIRVMAPGCKVIRVRPHLGDLAFAEGTFPTPYGLLRVKYTKTAGGKLRSVIKAPRGVKIIR